MSHRMSASLVVRMSRLERMRTVRYEGCGASSLSFSLRYPRRSIWRQSLKRREVSFKAESYLCVQILLISEFKNAYSK